MIQKRALIIGGTGFIGSHLAVKLVSEGYAVIIFDNLHPQIHGDNPEEDSFTYRKIKDQEHIHFVRGDVTDYEHLRSQLSDVEVVVHYAAETGTGQSMYEIKRYCHVNITGTANLLEVLAKEKHQVKKVIIASSRAIYGEGKYYAGEEGGYVYPGTRQIEDLEKGDFAVHFGTYRHLKTMATDEESRIHPISIYGITKQVQEQLVLTTCLALKIPAVALRYQNVYGPGQSLRNPYTGIISIFSGLLLKNEEVNIFEDGDESRDFVFIDDVVEATFLAISKDSANYHSFNVGTGVATTVMEVVQTLAQKLNIREPAIKISGMFRVGDIRHNYADLQKIEQALGFKPSVTFDQGMDKYCTWLVNQELPQNDWKRSIEEMKDKKLIQ